MGGLLDIQQQVSKSAYMWDIDKDKFYADRKVFGEETLPMWLGHVDKLIGKIQDENPAQKAVFSSAAD